MSEHRIKITETSSRIVVIETEHKGDALDIARDRYTNEQIVLGAEDYDDVKFEVV